MDHFCDEWGEFSATSHPNTASSKHLFLVRVRDRNMFCSIFQDRKVFIAFCKKNRWNAWGRFLCVLGDKTYDYLLGMKSDFRWPWNHRMNDLMEIPGCGLRTPVFWSSDGRYRCKAKSRNKVGWNMQLAFVVWGWWKLFFAELVNSGISSVLAWQISSFNETPRRTTTRCGMLFSPLGPFSYLLFTAFQKEPPATTHHFFGTRAFWKKLPIKGHTWFLLHIPNRTGGRTRQRRRRKRMRQTRRIRQCALSILQRLWMIYVGWSHPKWWRQSPPKHIVDRRNPGLSGMIIFQPRENQATSWLGIHKPLIHDTRVVMIGDTNERVG